MVADAIARTVPMAISLAMAAQGTGQAGTIPLVSDQVTGLATQPPDSNGLTSPKNCWS